MKSPYDIIQVYNTDSTVSCSIQNGHGKKRTPIWVDCVFTEDTIYVHGDRYTEDCELPTRVGKMIFSRRCK